MLTNTDFASYLNILSQGYRSEIVYTFRIRSKKKSGITFFSKSRSFSVIKKAGKDYLSGNYYINIGEEEFVYEDAEKFISEFFSCTTKIPSEEFFDNYYIEAKAETDLIRRPPPLSLLDTFFTSEKTLTGWVRYGG